MFNQVLRERVPFKSNPPLQDHYEVVPKEVDGVVINEVICKPTDHHSYWKGIHYSRETMSLRAKLNLGIPMSQVSLGQIENDPSVLARFADNFTSKVLNSFNQDLNSDQDSVVEPDKS